ncbi:MAG: aggregation factor core, partial [Pseudomonadota bacterium]
MLKTLIAAIGLCLLTSPARATLEVRFLEGAPKDRFTLTNGSNCPLRAADVTIDLSGSPFGLIFDTTGTGAGVQVFQPLELTDGAAYLREV